MLQNLPSSAVVIDAMRVYTLPLPCRRSRLLQRHGKVFACRSVHGLDSWLGQVRKILLFNNGAPGHVAQSITCLATDVCLTADPGVTSSIPARSHTFVEMDHEIISMVILLPSAESFKKGCWQ